MAKEFLTIDRREAQYRDNRLKDFKDVEVRADKEEMLNQALRCMECGIPFCHSAGCPLGNYIPEINRAVTVDAMEYAYNLLSQESPFPEFTSRICPALCESACCANLPSKPVNVKQLEYLVIEEAFKAGLVKPLTPKTRSSKTVAVIGAGPSGLAAAHYLNGMGYNVVVFEKALSAGGLLRYGIPDFKLEKHIVERRIDLMRQAGVVFEFSVEIGKDISANYINKKFDAICLCIGCEVPRDLKIEGRDFKNIHFALDYLRSQLKFNSGENKTLEIDAKGKKVLVIGGGDTGSDCMGTALRQGATEVVQIEIMPEPPVERHTATPWPQWEYKKRTSSSHKEGGTRMWDVSSKKFVADKDGNVAKLVASKVDWGVNETSMPSKFEEVANSEFEIEADLVLLSMGFVSVASPKLIEELSVNLSQRGAIAGSQNAKVFSCGDCASGASLVVRAIAMAKDTVKEIDTFLRNS
ncbi:MAG: glutamate synthase subunit beta [Opitutales bacterium]